MTTTTINANTTNFALLESISSTYAAARSGPATNVKTASSPEDFGQLLSGGNFEVDECLMEFDTSGIPTGATVSSVAFKLWGNTDESAQDFTAEARLYDYGTSIGASDFVGGDNLSSHVLLATYDTAAGWSNTGFNTFTEEGTNFRDNLVLGGTTRILLTSSRVVAGNAPTGNEYIWFQQPDNVATTERPQLVVTYTTVTTSTRTLSSTARLKAILTRTLNSTARLMQTHTRTLSSTALLTNRFTRRLSSTARLTATAFRTVASTARLRGAETRTVQTTARLTNRLTRSLSSSARLLSTLTRTIQSTARLAQQVTRTVSSTARLTGRGVRTVSSTAYLSAHQTGPLLAVTTTDGATHASADGAIHAVMTVSGGTKARLD